MRKKKPLPSIERLREVLSYNPETGRILVNGRPAGSSESGPRKYLRVMVDGVHIQQHRAAFALMTGRWPEGDVDHINGLGNDNRWENLRESSRAENNQNQGVSRNSTSGVTGVAFHKPTGKWRAYIVRDRKQRHLGLFLSKDEAAEAYAKAKATLHVFHPEQVTRLSLRAT